MSSGVPGKRWRIAEQDHVRASALAKSLDLPPIVAHMLLLRNIDTGDAINRFLNPSLSDLSDPFSLTDMDRAVARLQAARGRGENVMVFGDYDVDGITGTAVLVSALRRFGLESCTYGMPSRLLEGYGLSPDRVDAAAEQGVDLIVTVDNGINAREAADRAAELGIDLIVTDHHGLEGELPRAVAVVNPKREDETHPSHDLAGTAVALKLAMALTGEAQDLDLVALGTVADIVPLLGENRVLVALGLEQLASAPRPGLAKLAQVANVRLNEVTAEDIAFQLAPRINAAGRLGEGEHALELLLTESPRDAMTIARLLDETNRERREIESGVYEEALDVLAQEFDPAQRSVMLARENWHPGVIGIVASRLQRTHYRPTVLISMDENGVGRGSARSIDDFDLMEALAACQDHLVTYGGHCAAAGMTVTADNLGAFREAFEAAAGRSLPSGDLCPTLDIDALVSFSEIDSRFLKLLSRLEPFGNANPAPVFATTGVQALPGSVRELRGGHLKLAVKQDGQAFNAIGFRMGHLTGEALRAGALDLAFSPQFNTWRGETSIQLVLKDLRASA